MSKIATPPEGTEPTASEIEAMLDKWYRMMDEKVEVIQNGEDFAKFLLWLMEFALDEKSHSNTHLNAASLIQSMHIQLTSSRLNWLDGDTGRLPTYPDWQWLAWLLIDSILEA